MNESGATLLLSFILVELDLFNRPPWDSSAGGNQISIAIHLL